MKKQVAVIGLDAGLPDMVRDLAVEVGRIIAKNDCILICGGRGGVMEAACKGAKEAGGLTVGILPSIDGHDANRFLDVVIRTSYGYARNSLVVSAADVVVAINGSIGTLSEIALALNYERPVYVMKESGGVAGEIMKLKDLKVQKIREIDTGELDELLN